MALLAEKKSLLEEKDIAGRKMDCAHNDPIHPENQYKIIRPQNSSTRASEPHQGGGLGGWHNVRTLAFFI